MSGITRYAVIETALCIGSNLMEGEVFMVMATDHDRELAALREELAESKRMVSSLYGREQLLKEKLVDCSQALTAAEQRNSELLGILRSIRLNASPKLFSLGQLALVDAALKPTESGASE